MHFPIFFTNLLYSIGHQIIWLKYLRFLIWFSHLLWTSTSWERVARFSVSIFSYFDPIWAPDNHLVLIFLNLVSSFAEMIDHTIKKMLTHYSHWVYTVQCAICMTLQYQILGLVNLHLYTRTSNLFTHDILYFFTNIIILSDCPWATRD